MNKIWLNKNSKKELILFFNGWGMDMNIVNHIKPLGFNVCMLNNYNNLESLDDNFNDYDKIYIVAWSLGVWAAEQIISKSTIKIEKSIAINGTSLPIDNEYGIDKEIFAATVNNWNDKNKQKFWLRMFGSKIIFNDFRKCLPKRETLEQRDEIIYLQNEILNNNSLRNYTWDTAICGKNDKIFSLKNQKQFWTLKTKSKTFIADIPHFPFIRTNTWEDIINEQF